MTAAKTLVIIEAPGKLKKLRAILDPTKYDILASGGHVRDLPIDRIGVRPPEFVPTYVPTERGAERLKQLAAAARNAANIILATDPDREGEAIAWHIADALSLKTPLRVTYQSVEKQAVLDAMTHPRPINTHLVRAQEARRVLDRLVGYGVSPVLGDHLGRRASAGRVQSPAVRLVVERERAIAGFIPIRHFGVTLLFADTPTAQPWAATWDTKPYRTGDQEHIVDRALADAIAAVPAVVVRSVKNGEQSMAPPPPFTTTTLQRAAQVHLRLPVKESMAVAQALYEMGVITYHRTDAGFMSEEGFAQLSAYAAAQGLPVVDQRRTWKSKPGAQEAHEGIRPTHFDVEDAGDTPEQKGLYRLIRLRALASQMTDAVYTVRTMALEGTVEIQGQRPRFLARGRVLRTPGWKAIHDDTIAEKRAERDEEASARLERDEEPNDEGNPVPMLLEGDERVPTERRVRDQSTRPPPRFSESSLVAEMERLGIGRPATYAAIIENIKTRGYIAVNTKKQLVPGPEGEAVVDALVGRFAFIDLAFTSSMEEDLDRIATGQASYKDVVTQFHAVVTREVGVLRQASLAGSPACPACGKPMRLRPGKRGPFWSCTGYPDCKTAMNDDHGKPVPRAAPSETHACPDCGRPLRQIKGPKAVFWGCTGYWAKPSCKTTLQDDNGSPRPRSTRG